MTAPVEFWIMPVTDAVGVCAKRKYVVAERTPHQTKQRTNDMVAIDLLLLGVRRLGSSRTLRSDARLIAATNRDLKEMVDQQKFRSDLYYRLNVFPIKVPALRDRKEDIPLLVRHFVQEFSRRNNRAINTIPSEAMEVLVRYSWPGNIRELQNVIERAVIISRGPMLTVAISELDADIAPKQSKRTETAGMAAARINAVASIGETSNNSRWL